MATPSLSDLRYLFYGGGSAAEYAFLQGAQTAGISAQNILGLGYRGIGSPEGIVIAPVGSLYTDTNTGVRYSKNSGIGATGWQVLGAGGLLGKASSSAPFSFNNALQTIPGLAVPIPLAGASPSGVINIHGQVAWLDTPSQAMTVALAILEDTVVLNESVISMGGTASGIASLDVDKEGYIPTLADHTYYLQIQTTAGTARAFAEAVAPIVINQLKVEAA